MRLFFMRLNRDPNTDDEGGGAEASPIEEALNNQLTEGDPAEPAAEALKPGDEGYVAPKEEAELKPGDEGYVAPKEENLIDIEGYKGKDRRGAAKFEKERRADALERLNNINLDFEYGDKKSKKIAIDEVKNTLQWLQNNNETIAAGLSMQKFSTQYPQFKKVMDLVINGSFNDKNEFNAEFAEKVIKLVEAKEENLEDQVDEVDTEIAKIEKILTDEDIDPESVQGIALKSSMASLKAMKGQLGKALKQLEDVTEKANKAVETQTNVEKNKTDSEHKAEVTRIAKLFDSEIATLTAKDNKNKYVFHAEVESAEFDSMVRAGVSKAVAEYLKDNEKISDDQLLKFTRENAKSAYEEITKKREAIEAAYLKRKGIPKVEKKEDDPPENEGEMDLESLSKTVEDMLPTN